MKSYRLNDPSDFKSENTRLARQANILFQLEAQTFRSSFDGYTDRLLDFGCGNGSFLSLVKDQFRTVVGLDVNPELMELAKQQHPDAEFHCSAGLTTLQVVDLVNEIRPTGILLRLVAQHLAHEEWPMIEDLVKYAINQQIRIVIVDVEDSLVEIDPPSREVQRCVDALTDCLQRNGGNRHIQQQVIQLAENAQVQPSQIRRVDLVWDSTCQVDFKSVCLPVYKRASQGHDFESHVEQIFSEFFDKGGSLNTPIIYFLF